MVLQNLGIGWGPRKCIESELKNKQLYEVFLNLVNLIDQERYDAWICMVDVAIDLILFKDLILQEKKQRF